MLLRFCGVLTRWFPFVLVAFAVLAYLTPAQSRLLAPGVPYFIATVMLAMGLTMGIDDFRMVFSRPKTVILGVCLRYLLMPLVAELITKLLRLPAPLAAGFILIGCCPSAVASNVMTFLSRGNTALSVTISSCNTILAPVLTPYLFLFLAGSLIPVHAAGMLLDIARIVLLPVLAGVAIRMVASRLVRHVVPYLPAVSTVALILIVMAGVALSANRFVAVGLSAFLGVVLHNGLGLALGFLASRKLFGMTQADSQAITFEVGLENTGLAIALAIGHLDPVAVIPAAIFGAWHNVSGSALARYWASRIERQALRTTAGREAP